MGEAVRFTNTKQLMDEGHLSTIDVKCLLFNYSQETIKKYKRNYHDEIDLIVTHEKRNKFIANLALSLKGNTLILFNYIDKQGKPLYDLLKEENQKIDNKFGLWYIDGKIEVEEREQIRKFVDSKIENNIIEASFGTFQRGINMIHLHNIILASPTKSSVRILQSIGRGLRKRDLKTHLDLYDLADDLSKNNNRNYTLEHFAIRLKIYALEKFPFKIKKINLE